MNYGRAVLKGFEGKSIRDVFFLYLSSLLLLSLFAAIVLVLGIASNTESLFLITPALVAIFVICQFAFVTRKRIYRYTTKQFQRLDLHDHDTATSSELELVSDISEQFNELIQRQAKAFRLAFTSSGDHEELNELLVQFKKVESAQLSIFHEYLRNEYRVRGIVDKPLRAWQYWEKAQVLRFVQRNNPIIDVLNFQISCFSEAISKTPPQTSLTKLCELISTLEEVERNEIEQFVESKRSLVSRLLETMEKRYVVLLLRENKSVSVKLIQERSRILDLFDEYMDEESIASNERF